MNAKHEFLFTIEGLSPVKCAILHYGYYLAEQNPHLLKINYSQGDFLTFLEKINFDYNSGYGGQELFGIIWLEDGTWFDRGEYDGSEWWQHQSCPQIPDELL